MNDLHEAIMNISKTLDFLAYIALTYGAVIFIKMLCDFWEEWKEEKEIKKEIDKL
jgi:hypothetical protein